MGKQKNNTGPIEILAIMERIIEALKHLTPQAVALMRIEQNQTVTNLLNALDSIELDNGSHVNRPPNP